MKYCFKKGLLCVSIFLLFACSNGDTSKVISANTLLPKTKKNYSRPADTIQSKTSVLDSFELSIQKNMPNIKFISEDSSTLFNKNAVYIPNQLGFKSKMEYYFTLDSIPFHFLKWTFKDSLETVNAFYNWLDCFGERCNSIHINEKANGNNNSFLLYVNDTSIDYLESSKRIQRQLWEERFLQIKDTSTYNYILIQTPRGKIKWLKSIKTDNK